MNRLFPTLILAAAMSACATMAAQDSGNRSAQPASAVNANSLPADSHTEDAGARSNNGKDAKPLLEAALWQVSNVCYTPPGWCFLPGYAPAGTSCYCNFGGYVYWGTVH